MLSIKITVVGTNSSLPTRNMFIYAGSLEIRSSGGDESVERIFGVILVFEAFLIQEVVQMLEKLVDGGREVRLVWWIRQSFVAQFVHLLHGRLCYMWPGIVVGKNCLLSNDQCRHICLRWFRFISSIC